MFHRIALLGSVLGASLAAYLPSAAAQQPAYPAQRLTLIVPYNPGATPDIIARLVSPRLQGVLGQPVIVTNRSGAGSDIGTQAVISAAPDGYTIGIVGNPQTIHHLVVKGPTYNFGRDITPITNAASGFYALIVSSGGAAANFNSVAELVKFAKSNPGKLKFGSGGIATSPHLVGEWFKELAGVDILHVPYQGTDGQTNALLRGEIDMAFTSAIYVMSHIKAGKMKGLAVTLPQRDKQFFPELPTMREAGVNMAYTYWIGFFGPAKMPDVATQRLARELATILRDKEITEQLQRAGLSAVGDSPAQFAETIREETRVMTHIVEAAKLGVNSGSK